MDDVLLFAGKRCVVTGCASGMGAATARLLTAVGAHVIGLDVNATTDNVAEFHQIDLRERASIDHVAAGIGPGVASVFSVAGLPGAPFSDLDTVLVNFVGARHLIESLVPGMPAGGSIVCTASNAGLGWQEHLPELLPLVTTEGFDEGKAWCEANPRAIGGGYGVSKQLINAWVAWRGAQLSAQGIRLNCTNPGPTDTAMMPAFEAMAGKELIDAFIGPAGRRSTAEEQAWPMLFLNSPRSSYVAAEALHTDGGFLGAMVTDQLPTEPA
jgi:NAD(P)-dependent dehydrogenase (short-subunit alcohol dehydrogenase family)